MNVVIVNEGLAYPPKGGNWLRTLNLMMPLARRHTITYLCRAVHDRAAIETARAFYATHGIRFIATGHPPAESRGPAFYARVAANLLSPLPYSIASHRSRGVRAEMHRLRRAEQIDVWQYEALGYADTLLGTNARTILMAHNVESLIWQRLAETESHALKRWFIGHQVRKYERYEGRALRGASRVVAVSREDACLLRDRFGVESASVVDNGVDVGFFTQRPEGAHRDPKRILFLGSLDWRPNLDSIDLLLNRVMPRVFAEEPDARLAIVGRNPSPALVRRVRNERNVELHADVADVRPYLSNSGVMAVPLRIGGGSRLKILEAAAAGLPVVSTRIGCEGLIFTADRDLTVVETEDQMASALVGTIRHPDRAAAMAANARAVIDSHYDWSRLADKLEGVWFELAGA